MNLNQVTVPSIDVDKSTKFYQKLGLKLIVNALPRYVRFECPNGDSTFSIHQVVKLARGESTIVYFETEDLDKEVSRLKEKGIAFDQLPTEQSWLWKEAHLRDPDGNRIILYFAGKFRKDPPWRIIE